MTTNNGGITNIDVLSVGALYVGGKRFRDIIRSLISEDVLEQQEINDLRNILLYLNTTALNQSWIVNNDNRNSVLKTAIDLINNRLQYFDGTALNQPWIVNNDNRNAVLKTATDLINTRLLYIDTAALTQTSVLNNDNRNSVLKTLVDGLTTSVGNLDGKTRYITSSVGDNNANPKTFSQHAVVISNSAQRKRILLSPYPSLQGAFNIILQNDESEGHTVNTDPWALINRIDIKNLYGNIEIEGRKIHIQGKIEIGDFGDATTDRRPINIGGSMARINIGSEKTPKTGTGPGDPDTNDSTIITIGKLGTLKNTWTYLNGNVYTSDARFESLSATDVITWQTAASWAAGFVFSGVPYFLAWIGLSGVPNYRYSDVVKMANNYLTGGLTKNKAIETSNDLAISKLSVIDTSVVSLNTAFDALLGRLCFQAFTIHGSHSIGSIIGKSNIYAGSGEVELRVDGGVFDWAFKNAGNTNRVLLTNTDVEVVQCNGTGGTGRLRLVAGNGNIDFETANNGVRSNTTKVMEIKANKQIVIGSNSAMVDDTYKMIIDATSHTNGVFIRKGNDTLLLNPANVSSKSLTLQSGYSGTTTNAIYLNATNQLMFNGNPIGGAGGAGGLIFVINGPTANLTYTAANLSTINYTSSTTYTSRVSTRIRLSQYNNATNYNLFNFRVSIPVAANPFLKGMMEMNPYIGVTANQATTYYSDAFLFADNGGTDNSLINKTYSSQLTTGNIGIGGFFQSQPIPANGNIFTLTITQVFIPSVQFTGTSIVVRCEIIDDINSIVFYTFPTQTFNNVTSDITFTAPSAQTITQGFLWIGTRWRFRVTLVSGSSGATIRQLVAGDVDNCAFRVLTPSTYSTPLSQNVNNRVTLNISNSLPQLYSHEMPITDTDISLFNNPQIECRQFVSQTTGTTSGHLIDFYFYDGTISHLHTNLNGTLSGGTSTLSQVLTAGNSAGSSNINLNSNSLFNIPFGGLMGTDGIGWNVKNIVAGTGITSSNNGLGTVTIAASNSIIKVALGYNTNFNVSLATNNINFNMPTTYSLSSFRMKGKIVLIVDSNFDYGAIRFNGQGTIGSSNNLNEQTWSKVYEYTSAQNNSMAAYNLDGYLARDPIFAHMQNNFTTQIQLTFDIDLLPQTGSREPILVCKGTVTFGGKLLNEAPTYRAVCFFERWSNQTSINQISINNWNTSGNSIQYATLDLDVIPIPSFTAI